MTKDSAMEAIEKENKTQLLDKIIAVRTAVKKGDASATNFNTNANSNFNPTVAPTQQAHARPAAPDIGPIKTPGQSTAIFNHTVNSNHIEIMVMSKSPEFNEYADYIERKLSLQNLRVDIMYPRPNCEVGDILNAIKARGTLFAIQIEFDNVMDRTVTVYILYMDTIKWQKNMPLKEALLKVQEDSEKYIQPSVADTNIGNLTNKTSIQSGGIHSSFDSSEDPMENLLQNLQNLIKEQKVTVSQIDGFLEKCRKIRNAVAILEDPNAEPLPEEPEIDPAELALQKKLKSIVNDENYLDKLIGKRMPFKMTPERLTLLQNPKIERALDSLLNPDVFSTLDLKFIEKY